MLETFLHFLVEYSHTLGRMLETFLHFPVEYSHTLDSHTLG